MSVLYNCFNEVSQEVIWKVSISTYIKTSFNIYLHYNQSAAPAAATTASADAPNGWQRQCGGDIGGPHSWPRETQIDPAAAGPAASCTQVPAPGAGERRGEGVRSSSLPHNEERPQPHDPLPGWQVLPGWVAEVETRLGVESPAFWLLSACFDCS